MTGCRLAKRALKFRDWGKMAATFVDLASGRAIRIVALESSKQRAREMFPGITDRNQQQMKAYRELSDAQLFQVQRVGVTLDAAELPGFKSDRFICPRCGEGVNFGRFIDVDGEPLCLSCARPELHYWSPER